MTYLSTEQVAQLLRGINPARVSHDDAGYSHLQAYDVRAHLNRIFGFARWSADLLDLTALYEQETTTKQGKPAYKTAYRATLRLTVHAPDGTLLASYTEAAVGEATMPDFKRGDCADMAIKTAESQALKRCATNLGDQFGLSLYAKGSTAALVKRTLLTPETTATATNAAVDHDTVPVVPETPAEEMSSSSAVEPPPVPDPVVSPSGEGDGGLDKPALVAALRERVLEAMQHRNRNEALQMLTRISMEAGQRKVLSEPTMSPSGEPMTLNVLVDEAIKHRTRSTT